MNCLTKRKRRTLVACMILLHVGSLCAQSPSVDARIQQLESALKQLAEQNAKLIPEVEGLKSRMESKPSQALADGSLPQTGTSSVASAPSKAETKDPTELIWI